MTLGPSFAAELAAAGLAQAPIAWNAGGLITSLDSLDEPTRSGVAAVLAAHDPARPDPAAVPDVISDRQFGQGLWHEGIISFAECEGFVSTGAVPAALQALLDTLPDDDTGAPTPRKEALILVKGAKEYRRHHPLTETVRQAFGWSAAETDAHWRTWAEL